MGTVNTLLRTLDPIVTERACGGWLAASPDASLRIAVLGQTEFEARERFRQSVERWRHYAEIGKLC